MLSALPAEAWEKLSEEDFHALSTRVAVLPSELIDEDETAKRFDLLLLQTQLSILQAGPDFPRLREKKKSDACSALEAQENIPAIKAEMWLIQEAASDEWWKDIGLPALEI